MILVENDGQRWLVSPYGMVAWVHNVRAQPQMSVFATVGSPRRFMPRRSTLLQPVPSSSGTFATPRVTPPFFDAKGDDPVEKFIEEAPRHPEYSQAHRRLSLTAPVRRPGDKGSAVRAPGIYLGRWPDMTEKTPSCFVIRGLVGGNDHAGGRRNTVGKPQLHFYTDWEKPPSSTEH